jgi:uncharacterized protein (TIGR02646 family)
MRIIDNYFDALPDGIKPETLIQKGIILRILTEKRVKTEDYKGKDGDVKKSLLSLFHNCCAFCESRVNKYDDIEHFRPKHEITGVNTEGYYWLSVVWSNLLMACKVCNSDYKKNNFPVQGSRVTLPQYANLNEFFTKTPIQKLSNEKPLLIHPVLDNPDKYLVFEENGTVLPKNNHPKGINSIQFYGLSDWDNRPILIQDRKYIVEEVRKRVKRAIQRQDNDDKLYEALLDLVTDLIEQIQDKRPYSAVRRSCLKNFKPFFIDKFTGIEKQRLTTAYDRVKTEINN